LSFGGSDLHKREAIDLLLTGRCVRSELVFAPVLVLLFVCLFVFIFGFSDSVFHVHESLRVVA